MLVYRSLEPAILALLPFFKITVTVPEPLLVEVTLVPAFSVTFFPVDVTVAVAFDFTVALKYLPCTLPAEEEYVLAFPFTSFDFLPYAF